MILAAAVLLTLILFASVFHKVNVPVIILSLFIGIIFGSDVTGLIDRLENQGLVERCEADDRRATRVRLTAEGRRVLDEVLPAYRGVVEELTGCLTAEEKATLVQLLTKLRRELRRRWKETKG